MKRSLRTVRQKERAKGIKPGDSYSSNGTGGIEENIDDSGPSQLEQDLVEQSMPFRTASGTSAPPKREDADIIRYKSLVEEKIDEILGYIEKENYGQAVGQLNWMETRLLKDPRVNKVENEYMKGIEAHITALKKYCNEHTRAEKKIPLPTDSNYTSVSDSVK